jgi:hypothetical protein
VTADASALTLDALKQADAATLRQIWMEAKGSAPPRTFTARLMRLALAWEVQAKGGGGETAQIQRAWVRFMRGRTRYGPSIVAKAGLHAAKANGTRILKEWGGTTHEVRVEENGAVVWNDQRYTSLSAVARAMTGTNRNGPKFFGLREGAKT